MVIHVGGVHNLDSFGAQSGCAGSIVVLAKGRIVLKVESKNR
jgi:hypothetical protein